MRLSKRALLHNGLHQEMQGDARNLREYLSNKGPTRRTLGPGGFVGMNLAIFGATGRTGRCLVDQALGRGHQVTALARNPDAISRTHTLLRVVAGDVLDADAVNGMMTGQQAVVSALGIPPWTREPVLLEGIRNILHAMERFSVGRLVSESSFGVADSKAQADWLTNLVIRVVMGKLFQQKEQQEVLIRQSRIEWIIIRPARLTNGPAKKTYRSGQQLE